MKKNTIALIAHDKKKPELITFCSDNKDLLNHFSLIATGTTGQQIMEKSGLQITCYLSGPMGGDAQIAAQVAVGEVAGVIFLVDPLYAHPHEPDIQSLLRVCNVHNIPLATNLATAKLIIKNL